MLSRVAIEAARELAEVLERGQRTLRPVEETPVDNLVQHTEPVEPIEETVEEAMETLATVTVTAVPGLTAETHDDAMAEAVQPVVELVNRRLALARQVVNPLITEYDRLMLSEVQNEIPTSPSINVIPYDDYYSNTAVQNIFKGYNVAGDETTPGFKIENFNFRDYLTTGSRLVDEKIQAILAEVNQSFLSVALDGYFKQGESFTQKPIRLAKASTEEVAVQFIAHFILRKLYNSDVVIPNEGDEVHRNLHLMKALAITAKNVENYVASNNEWIEKGRLFAEPDQDENVINVYGPSYQSYQENQGQDISVLGAYLSRPTTILSYQNVLDKKDEYNGIHDQTMLRRQTDLANSRNAVIRNAAIRHLGTIVSQIPDDVLLALEIERDSDDLEALRSLLISRGKAYIEDPRTPIGEDLWSYASDIICGALLTEMELKSFFDTMEKYLRPVEGVAELDAKQAAYYAILNEIVTYFLSQTSMDHANA